MSAESTLTLFLFSTIRGVGTCTSLQKLTCSVRISNVVFHATTKCCSSKSIVPNYRGFIVTHRIFPTWTNYFSILLDKAASTVQSLWNL